LRNDYVPKAKYRELMQKLEAAESAKKGLEDAVRQLEQEKEMLWLQANPDEFS
jgi:hypothetical protein